MPKKTTDEDDRPYTGILVKPLPKRSIFNRPEEVDAELDDKLKALFDHYGVDPKKETAWVNLTLKLARRHVPGFRGPPREPGRPPERKLDDLTLFLHVELWKKRDELSEREAIKKIAAQKVVEGTETALRGRYKRAKPNFVLHSKLFDWAEARLGNHAFVKFLEESLAEDKKDSILSPG